MNGTICHMHAGCMGQSVPCGNCKQQLVLYIFSIKLQFKCWGLYILIKCFLNIKNISVPCGLHGTNVPCMLDAWDNQSVSNSWSCT